MSSRKYKKPLNLNLRPSKILFMFIVLIHLLALSMLSLNLSFHFVSNLLIIILIGVSAYYSLEQACSIRFKRYIVNIKFLKDMQYSLSCSDQQSYIAELKLNWFELPYVVILYFKTDFEQNKSIIILPDMLDKSELRQLKLHLRLLK